MTPAPRSAGAVSTQPSDRFSRPDPASAVWLGHATVLLRLGSRWVLTDPVFSDRVGPRIAGRTMGVSRREPPPIEPANLPPIDIVLLSHAHFDHLDLPSLRALASERTGASVSESTRRVAWGVSDLRPLRIPTAGGRAYG